MIIDNPQPKCSVCQHLKREEIHQLYFVTHRPITKGSWRAFLESIGESFPGEFGMSNGNTVFKRHFKGSNVKGKIRLPHFSVGARGTGTEVKKVVNETIAQIEERLESKGLLVAESVIDEIADGTRSIKNSEAINLMGKIATRRATKDALELKKMELNSKNKRFDKALLAALYGNSAHIKDAILVPNDNDGNAQGLLRLGETGVLEEHHQGENG
jgi:hypothetical protein